MSFSRAVVKRFNDVSEVTPSPLDYDPKLPHEGPKGGVAVQTADRFGKDKEQTPGKERRALLSPESS